MLEPIEISIVLPCYQEEHRLGNTLKELISYLEKNFSNSEILVVCDGCTDGTANIAKSMRNTDTCQVKLIELIKNLGKGAAVKQGMLAASGKYLFFTDADLSFAPETIAQFVEKLDQGADLVIAQRQKSATYTHLGRRILGSLSRAIVGNILLHGIRDSQAGFKAFQHQAAKFLFAELKTCGYLFDFELLLKARRNRYRIDKVYVDWFDRPGSKVRFWKDSFCAAKDLIIISIRELLHKTSRH